MPPTCHKFVTHNCVQSMQMCKHRKLFSTLMLISSTGKYGAVASQQALASSEIKINLTLWGHNKLNYFYSLHICHYTIPAPTPKRLNFTYYCHNIRDMSIFSYTAAYILLCGPLFRKICLTLRIQFSVFQRLPKYSCLPGGADKILCPVCILHYYISFFFFFKVKA